MRFRNAEELIRNADDIPSLPQIVYRLDQSLQDPRANFNDFANIIAEDSALSAHLLRIANSSLYQFPETIDTVSRAVTLIGTKQLKELVVATSITRLFSGLPNSLVDMGQFWQHSIGCGISAKVIAGFCRLGNTERYYLLGLLHDIGRLVLYRSYPELAMESFKLAQEQDTPLYRAEQKVLGFDHSNISAMLLKSWKLPMSVRDPVEFHHSPHDARYFSEDAFIVHLADALSHSMLLGNAGEPLIPPLDPLTSARLNIPPARLEPIMQQVDREYGDALTLFLSATSGG
ncbi:HDOD domain-containing protein [Desulfurispira natronophila]|uniref:HD-like signal output (HDOD) protein n=1 Tax=Desulfurispira natronophila TaxID=682562 RepID=A0A7W7Y3N0_9BACT|nr:HDOD domain-containing protein [Desulfurispira natronophila]MBB5021506.1 HD-like signal output (HDOD) protein [Desulfurispira natronophila]